MSTTLTETWLQEVVQSIQLPAVSPTVSRILLPVIEAHLRKIIQQGNKFQRRAKSNVLTVEDINLALSLNKIDQVYGFRKRSSYAAGAIGSSNSSSSGVIAADSINAATAADTALTKLPRNSNGNEVVDLVELSMLPLPPCPLKAEVTLHWLAVQGVQPQIPENPSVQVNTAADMPLELPRELQNLYARVTGILLADEAGPGLRAVFHVLRYDRGLQELAPYFSRFCYQQIRRNTKRLSLLQTIISAIKALMSNSMVNLEFHLQQLLPAIFTCVVAAKLCTFPSEDHWSLRQNAAELIALICHKYSGVLPELQARVCKTYLEALGTSDAVDTTADAATDAAAVDEGKSDENGATGQSIKRRAHGNSGSSSSNSNSRKTLGTLYGGIVGLTCLGNSVVRAVLLEQLQRIQNRLQQTERQNQLSIHQTLTSETETTDKITGAKVATVGTASYVGTVAVGVKRRINATSTTDSSNSCSGRSPQLQRMERLQELAAAGKCREALSVALGKFLVHCMRLPHLSVEQLATRSAMRTIKLEPDAAGINSSDSSNNSSSSSSNRKRSRPVRYEYALCDLEESLIPYYVSASKQDYYCRLFI